MADGIFRYVFMASAQMTVCEYKTQVFRGRQEAPVGASVAQNDGDLRVSVGCRRPSSVAGGSTVDLFYFPTCYCIK